MKNLYVSDLDGTLLNSKGQLTDFSAIQLKKMINDGVMFSIATARTAATVTDIFKDVGLNTPIALMNGVMVYDTKSSATLINHSIDKSTAGDILNVYSKHNKHPMLYFDKGSLLEIVYTEIDNKHQYEYITDRNSRKLKKFIKADKYNLNRDEELLYIVSFDNPEELDPIYKEISKFKDVISCFYADNYTDCNFLETMNGSISKGTAAAEIKKLTGADKIIAFGDNLNDIPMFNIADEAYAVSNAHPDLKKLATGVLDSNDDDSVVKFILKHSENNRG